MKTNIKFICNNSEVEASVHPGLSLMDFLRNNLALTGTKEGCREGDCGACTVLIGELQGQQVLYHSVNSCLFPVGNVNGKHVVTIEGLNSNDLSIVQRAFVDEGASQCGFCTPGFIVSLTGYFISNKVYSASDATYSMDGNICRCTGHSSIIRAAKRATEILVSNITNHSDHILSLIKGGLIPSYFSEIPSRLKKLKKQQLKDLRKETVDFSIAGGTDLFVQQWENILKNEIKLLSTNGISSFIKEENQRIVIGAKASVSDFINSKVISNYLPSLKAQLKLFGSLPIRNMATIGGNIVNASPIADMTNILLTLNSALRLKRENKFREIRLRDFYKGYKSLDLLDGELIDEINFRIPKEGSYFNFEKVSQRTFLDIASANSSLYIELENSIITNCSLSAGGVAPIPLYLKQASEFLSGKELNYSSISEAADIALTEISPISDARGSAEYKSILLRQLIYAHFVTLFPDKINVKELA